MIQSVVNTDLILHLILQDMRHRRFILALEKIGFDADNQYLDIGRVVAGLMGIPGNAIPDEWLDTYCQYLDLAAGYPEDGTGASLKSLAQLCYEHIMNISG